MNFKHHNNCRVCGSDKLVKYLDLGKLPLTNNLCSTIVEIAETYPLQIMVCQECWLSQLSIVVDPEIMFSNYVYRSSISKDYRDHCRQMAKDLKKEYNLNEQSFHVDVASNDCALLTEFKQEIGLKILGVDPAKNLAAICQAKEVPTLIYFWSSETARRIFNGGDRADLITATNVFAHVDDMYDFIEAAKILLKPTGILIIESPYLVDFIENNEFDCTYQEHVSYISVGPVNRLCKKLGMNLMKVEKKEIHGGSIRLHIGFGYPDNSVHSFIQNEELYRTVRPYEEFAKNAERVVIDFRVKINELKMKGHKIAGFGAAAKGNTMLNAAGITCGSISYIVDSTPEKLGKYSPGTHIPIVSMLELEANPPDYLILLAWNWEKELIESARKVGYRGKFIIAIPQIKIID